MHITARSLSAGGLRSVRHSLTRSSSSTVRSRRTTSFPAATDRALVTLLRASLGEGGVPSALDTRAVLDRAELHGVAGVARDALRAASVGVDASTETRVSLRETARELDHAAHLAMLARIDGALANAGIHAVVLKGPLFAERFYARPGARGTTDIDLLVAEGDIDTATRALAAVGYSGLRGREEERFRREHHHLHFAHASAVPLELHFHAYRGFGSVMRSEPLISRRRAVLAPQRLSAIGVLEPQDELVYLAVHAASHRFGRLAWLYDLALLLRTMTAREVDTAAKRARSLGYARALAFAGTMLVDTLGVDPDSVARLGALGPLATTVVQAIVAEPAHPWSRSATRFVYTAALCDTPRGAVGYAYGASVGHARRVLRRLTSR